MNIEEIKKIFTEWAAEISSSVMISQSYCIALFTTDKRVLFANDLMMSLFKGDPFVSFINPDFDQFLSMDKSKPLIFQGYITLGDYTSVNTSIWANVYQKNEKILLLGGMNSTQLSEQNRMMHQLNSQISYLQRQLIKEKEALAKTLIQLNDTNKNLELINASKDKFFSIIALDLKSPFNAIIGFSELMLESVREKDYDSAEFNADIVLQSSTRAMDLLTNLMQWAQSQTGRIEYSPESFDLLAVIQEIVLFFDNIAEQKSIVLIRELPLSIPVFCDKDMIKTVLRNLISNAIKFTKPGGEIKISATLVAQETIVSVSDSGIGIPKERIDTLFKIDESYSTAGTQNEQGTGLGLILCKEFIEKNGGAIHVESEQEVGSRFYFTIPAVGDR